jgi:molybdenum cofactor cytidylyltransferase
VAAVLLAAGAGSRFTSGTDIAHKLLAPFGEHTVVWASASSALASGLRPIWVVTGATDLSEALPEGAVQLPNPDWAKGQASSLQVAVNAARAENMQAIVVGLADQPGVTAGAWRSLADASAPIAVATYDGVRRNPVRLSASMWDLLPTEGDQGARSVIRSRPDLVREVPCEGDPADIDTREDLERWT